MDKQMEIERLKDLCKAALNEKNYELAFDYCKQAALLGNVTATYLLGRLCLSGEYVGMDLSTALRMAMTCFTLAADCGFEPAEKMIAKVYSDYRILSDKLLSYSRDEAEKLYSLGNEIIYKCDIGETPDYKKAFEYFSEAAKLFDSYAMEELGYLYRNGNGVDKDEKKAAQWFARAAHFNFYWEKHDLYQLSEEMREGLQIGRIIQVGDYICISDLRRSLGLRDDFHGSFNPLVKSAEFGNADSILELAHAYDDKPLMICNKWNKIVKPDKERAEMLYRRAYRCYKKAAEAGDYSSVYGLIAIYDSPVSGLNMKDEIAFIEKCADSYDIHSLKKYVWDAIGEVYRDGNGMEPNGHEAIKYFQKAENWQAIGEVYRDGNGGVEPNRHEAIKYFQKVENWQAIGEIYRDDIGGVEQDVHEAIKYFTECKHWRAIGEMYRDGIGGIEPSGHEAIVFFNKAADLYHSLLNKSDAWRAIAEIYRDGIGGVERDPQKADEYFAKAESCKVRK